MLQDIDTTRRMLQARQTSATAEMERCIAAAQAPACAPAWTRTLFDAARATAADPKVQHLPLAGLAVSVKDLFDLQGQPTPAGSVVLADAPAAQADCAAVARLRAAGAALIGRTHMVEFAFSGVGTNPHCATPAAWDARSGALPGPARVPGGSSSGAGVSVATGAAFIGLGSDTGGSIRIPAALNGIVGFKNTARLVPTTGAVPLSSTLDTACAVTRSVRDAVTAHEILAARRVTRSPAPLSAWRLAVPQSVFLDGLDPTVAHAFARTLDTLRQAGAPIVEMALPEVGELGDMQANGSLSAAESHAWHRQLLAARGDRYDPRVRSRIERGATMLAADYIDLLRARRDWIARMETAMAGFDALLSPTVPMVAPPIALVAPADGRDPDHDAERDAAFFSANALLLRNTSVVNMLDGCALSLPCHVAGELPVGLMVWHAALHDDAVLNVGLQAEKILQKQ
ncbi:amidase [Acidovorax sp. SRB_14]|uniref:amidase n=1 Tax=unclassified Acidovorax TaxID=2684926 RepID=UPI00145F2403|nr:MULTISPECIES: amidase [unclassified Acidovorax]NMM75153.1 amidase [Acidovorax sp. SRB_24]NMM79874.1 amidase [Acidovorax sp. SRB_14]